VAGGLFGNGTTTAFDFNSFDLRGSTTSANLSFTLQAFLGGNLVDSAVLNVVGNTFSTYTENWTNVDTVVIASTAGLPVNWGSGTLYMDNVVINNTIAAPAPLIGRGLPVLLAFGGLLLGAKLLGRGKRHGSLRSATADAAA
jgi:hypothetical protein